MKDMIYRFTVLVVILILFNMTHLEGNQKNQKIIELPVGFFQEPYHVDLKSKVIKYLEKNEIFKENKIEDAKPEGLEFDIEPDKKNGIEKYGIHFWKEKGVIHGKPDIKDQDEAESSLMVTKLKYKGYELKTIKDNIEEPVTIAYKLNVKKHRWDLGENFYIGIGFQHSSASGRDSHQKFFGNMYISAPFPIPFKSKDSLLGSPLKLWGDIRVTTLPQQFNSSLAEAPDKLKEEFKSLKVNEVVRGVEFLVGLELRIFKLFLKNKKYTLNLIGAWGAINPINPNDSIDIYELNPEARTVLAKRYIEKEADFQDKTKKYVAFVNQDRKRFFQQRYIGIRIKSYTNPKLLDLNKAKFPATFELSYGVNDFIVPKFNNDGKLNSNSERGLLRIGGYIPFKLSNGLNLYVFGTAFIQLGKEKFADTTDPLIMNPKLSTEVSFPGNDKIVQLPFFKEPRDFFKIGIGINLRDAYNWIFKNKKKDSPEAK
jgi:hypothetical protein